MDIFKKSNSSTVIKETKHYKYHIVFSFFYHLISNIFKSLSSFSSFLLGQEFIYDIPYTNSNINFGVSNTCDFLELFNDLVDYEIRTFYSRDSLKVAKI